MATILDKVKLAVRRTDTTAFDAELYDLIMACVFDLELVGIHTEEHDPTRVYKKRDRCIKDEMFYVARRDTTGAFNNSDWLEDPLIIRAICTFVKANFGETDNTEALKASYDEQKGQMLIAAHYADYTILGVSGSV